jgi:hypothetical protein
MGIRPTTKTAASVIAAVKRQFGDEAGVQVTDTDIIRWINDAQREILTANRVFKAKALTNIVAGTYEYTFPTEPIIDVQSIWVNGKRIEFKPFQEYEEYVVSADPTRATTGTPAIWTEWAGSFIFWPTPDVSVSNGITIYYTKGPTDVVNPGDTLSVPDLYLNRIIEYCMGQAYELDEDYQASQYKLSQFTEGLGTQDDTMMPSQTFYPRITVLDEDYY